jgi:hypothetical protein
LGTLFIFFLNFQTGTGHFSPIGGYHAGRDMALILDVAWFKYPPHWVPLTLLWEAMDRTDETTAQRRGYGFLLRYIYNSWWTPPKFDNWHITMN